MEELPAVRIPDGRTFARVPTFLTQPHDTNSQPQPWHSPSLPEIEPLVASNGSISRAIVDRLWEHAIDHPIQEEQEFWPPKLFDHLFNETAVRQVIDELVDLKKLPVDEGASQRSAEDAKSYWADVVCGKRSFGSSFRHLLALLLLVDKPECIRHFISQKVTDKQIPLNKESYRLANLDRNNINLCLGYQRRLRVPFLAPERKEGEVRQVIFEVGDIEPWYRTDKVPQRSSSLQTSNSISGATAQLAQTTLGGGYGDVYQIFIHPWQHDFHEILKSLSVYENLFALKRLHSRNKRDFEKETMNLKRFGGHRNIVTLLATITIKKDLRTEEYHLLFPWAEGDLLSYWQRTRRPGNEDHDTIIWISNQILGVVRAIDYIHNPDPPKFNHLNQRVFGRHGDIKPENILWFKSDEAEILVMSDLGLSVVNSKNSRSNIPGKNIPATPNYRPPECDMDGIHGHISRSFDIWTLGCLLLEFVVWTLDGWQGRETFRSNRFSPYINNNDTDIFFEVRPAPNEKTEAIFMIKESVEEEFSRLHQHKDCTQYLHELLDLVQEHMLILESDKPLVERIKSPELRQEIETFSGKCSKDREYCFRGCPRETTHKKKEPVRAKLNNNALEAIRSSDMNGRVAEYSGKTRSANIRRSSTGEGD